MQDWEIEVDGTVYSLPNLPPEIPTRIQVDTLSGGLTVARSLTFSQKNRHDSPFFDQRDTVQLWTLDELEAVDEVFFWGKIQDIEHRGDPGNEWISYTCDGPLALMNKIPWIHDGKARIAINIEDEDDEDFDSNLQGLTVEDIISEIFSDMGTEVQSEAGINLVLFSVNVPSVVPKEIRWNAPMGILDMIDQLLRWIPGAIRHVIPGLNGTGTLQILYSPVDLLPYDITLGGGNWIQNDTVRPSSRGRYGALQFIGKRAIDDELLEYDPAFPGVGTLEPAWDPADETGWNPAVANESSDKFKVFRVYRQAGSTKEWARSSVRSTPNTTVKCWSEAQWRFGGVATVQEFPIRRQIEDYSKEERQIVLSHPVYKKDLVTGAYIPTKVWLRLCRLGNPVTVRKPPTPLTYEGEAYDEFGIQDVWRKYAEKLTKITFYGSATEDSPSDGIIIDMFTGLSWFHLVGKTVTSGVNTGVITIHDAVQIEHDGLWSLTEGDDYTIEAVNTVPDFEDIIDSLFVGMTSAPKAVDLTKYDWDSFLPNINRIEGPPLINLVAFDAPGHITGWEEINVLLTSWTLNYQAYTIDITADRDSSVAVQDYNELIQNREIVNSVEELEIYVLRQRGKDNDTGSDSTHEVTNVQNVFHITETIWTDGTNDGPIRGWVWDPVSESWDIIAVHDHSGDPADPDPEVHKGGWLDVAATLYFDDPDDGLLAATYDSDTGEVQATWKSGPF